MSASFSGGGNSVTTTIVANGQNRLTSKLQRSDKYFLVFDTSSRGDYNSDANCKVTISNLKMTGNGACF